MHSDRVGGGQSSSSSSSKSSTGKSCSVQSTDSSVMGSDGGGGDVVPPTPVAECALLIPDTTQYWKGFKFTAVYPRQSPHMSGWEVTCCWNPHKLGGRCRRTYRFVHHGGAFITEKLLKHWRLTSHLWPHREPHRLSPDPPVEELPTLIEMDATVWPPPDVLHN